MGFKYPCFISYCHGQKYLIKGFISEFKENLDSSLEAYFDEGIYVDTDRLDPGFKYNNALAKAICQSLCMIVIYIPKYDRHEYCRKEFAAMEYLEEKRFRLIGNPKLSDFGMIIPVILRGEKDDLPQKIAKNIHYADFSRWTTASIRIKDDEHSIDEIEKIAKYIHKLYKSVENYCDNIFCDCESFRLPENAPLWNDSPITQTYPGSWNGEKGV